MLILWDYTWIWNNLELIGDENWLINSIQAGTCMAVTDGSYIKELYPIVCSAAIIIKCQEGRGRIMVSFPKHSIHANAYRGEMLGLLAINIILLAANTVCPTLSGMAHIYSDCLGALTKICHKSKNRIPARCKHSDILKNVMIHRSEFTFDCV